MNRVALICGLAVGWIAGRRSGPRLVTGRGPGPSEFDFLSLMSHELKTPINIIAGYLELLESGVPDPLPASAREHVQHARMAALRMTDLVNDLLTWTRLESGRGHIHAERTTAANIVEDACSSIREQATAQGISLETDVPEGLVLRTDPSRACQALRALVANGLKFTEAGSVRVTAERAGEGVCFRVRDTGIGIAPEHLGSIFEPYWQAEATVRRTRGGVGIGLTVARELARLLGGDITVATPPGGGSEFVLNLPGDPDDEDRPAGG